MPNIYLLGTSEGGRPTNAEHQLTQLIETHPTLKQWRIVRTKSNTEAFEILLKSNPDSSHLVLAPFYNVYGKSVRDTMEILSKNQSRVTLIHISKLMVNYILVHHRGIQLPDVRHVASHEQAILQTQANWNKHKLRGDLEKVGDNNTAAGLNYLIENPDTRDTVSISTPWQWRESDEAILARIDNFGPRDNYTYFGIFGLRNSEIKSIPSAETHKN